MIVYAYTKPAFGRIVRYCMACDAEYVAYHMYLCPDCQKAGDIIVLEEWAR